MVHHLDQKSLLDSGRKCQKREAVSESPYSSSIQIDPVEMTLLLQQLLGPQTMQQIHEALEKNSKSPDDTFIYYTDVSLLERQTHDPYSSEKSMGLSWIQISQDMETILN